MQPFLMSAAKGYNWTMKKQAHAPKRGSSEGGEATGGRPRDPATSRSILEAALALGSEVGSVELFIGLGESTSSLHRSDASETGQSETVQITTVDRICAEQQIGTIDLLKIDTEGHEMDVLAGASKTLRDDRILAIQIEFGETFLPTKYHFCDVYDLLSPKYKLYRVLRQGLYEVDRYTHDLEIYKLTNYLCIHR